MPRYTGCAVDASSSFRSAPNTGPAAKVAAGLAGIPLGLADALLREGPTAQTCASTAEANHAAAQRLTLCHGDLATRKENAIPAAEIVHATNTTAGTAEAAASAPHLTAAAPSGSLATTHSSCATEQLATAPAVAADTAPSCLGHDTEQLDTATAVAADTDPSRLDRDPDDGSSTTAELRAAAAQIAFRPSPGAAAGLEGGSGSSSNREVNAVLESAAQRVSSAPVTMGHELSMTDIQLPDGEPAITQEANAA